MKAKILDDREKRIVRLITLTAGVWVILTTSAAKLAELLLKRFSVGWQVAGVIASAALALSLLWFGRERLIGWLLRAVNVTPSEEAKFLGSWTIRISYSNGDREGSQTSRTGELLVARSATGLALRGGKLFDEVSQELVVETWSSEFAEVIGGLDRRLLVYSYKIKRELGETHFDKLGYVIAEQQPDGSYRGSFLDLALLDQENESIRKGEVVLWRRT